MIPAAIFLITVAMSWLFLIDVPAGQSECLLLAVEIGIPAAVATTLLRRMQSGTVRSILIDTRWLITFFVSLFVGEIVYNCRIGGTERYPINYIGDLAYSVALVAVIGVMYSASKNLYRSPRERVARIALWSVLMAAEFHFILFPLFQTDFGIPTPAFVLATAYAALECVAVALALPLSLRVKTPRSNIFIQSFLLSVASGFALRHAPIQGPILSSAWTEACWSLSVMGMAVAVLWPLNKQAAKILLMPVSDNLSVRTLWGVLGFGSNVILLVGISASPPFRVVDGSRLSAYLIFATLAHIASNTLAVKIVSDLDRIISSMWSPGQQRNQQTETHAFSRIRTAPKLAEIGDIINRYNHLAGKAESAMQELSRRKQQAALGQLSSQVAHDVKSPLAALRMGLATFDSVPEDTRVILTCAIQRIEDITSELLLTDGVPLQTQLPVPLDASISRLVSEKRLQHRSRSEINISASFTAQGTHCFVTMASVDIQRVFSNLVDNAIEALVKGGNVEVNVTRRGMYIIVEVKDNGRGMSAAFMASLGRPGVTSKTSNGHGLGIPHARRLIENLGGDLCFQSTPGVGSRAIVKLPTCRPPMWHVESLDLTDVYGIAVLDDDPSIHAVWRRKLGTGPHSPQRPLLHFHSAKDFVQHVLAAQKKTEKWLCLVDHQIGLDGDDGASIISRLGIASTSVLVTHHFDDARVVDKCRDIALRMLPKFSIMSLDLFCDDQVNSRQCQAVLIDDDSLVHRAWKVVTKSKGISLAVFSNPEDFLRKYRRFSNNPLVFLDAQVCKPKGVTAYAQEINDLGFSVCLATGESAASLKKTPWMCGTVGKDGNKACDEIIRHHNIRVSAQ